MGIVTEYDLLHAMIEGRDLRNIAAVGNVDRSSDGHGGSNAGPSGRTLSGEPSHAYRLCETRNSSASLQGGTSYSAI